jgi:hypothetical protein
MIEPVVSTRLRCTGVREIERIVRADDPFLAPIRMGKVTCTDTWLWDQSCNFQLATLAERQN